MNGDMNTRIRAARGRVTHTVEDEPVRDPDFGSSSYPALTAQRLTPSARLHRMYGRRSGGGT